MAVIRGKSPVVMTAATDTLTPTGDKMMWKVAEIRVVNGATPGDVLLLDYAGSTRTIFRSNSLGANDVDGTTWARSIWMDDIYVQTLPSGAIVEVYYS